MPLIIVRKRVHLLFYVLWLLTKLEIWLFKLDETENTLSGSFLLCFMVDKECFRMLQCQDPSPSLLLFM